MLIVALQRSGGGLHLEIELPPKTEAQVFVPLTNTGAIVLVNGRPAESAPAENGARALINLNRGGRFDISVQE